LFLIGRFLKIFFSVTASPNEPKLIWPSDFRGDDILEINHSETRIACGGHVW
jgi:hypothetical protein